MKICTKCKLNKNSDFFRVRYDKRRGGFYYLNSTCRKCDGDIAKKYYNSVKDIHEFKLKNRERVKKYRVENIDAVREKDQYRRQTKRHKENRKKYIQKNKEKIFAQEKINKRKYHEKIRDELSDVYVARKIVGKSKLSANEIPPQLIKLKRLQLLGKRILKTKTKWIT